MSGQSNTVEKSDRRGNTTITQNPKVRHGRGLPDGYMTISEFSRAIGLRGGGLYRELDHHNIRTKKHGRYRIITVEQAQKYLDLTELDHIPRVTKRPSGWVTAMRAAGIVGCSHSVIWKAANEGEIKAVRRGYTRYHDPDDVERFRLAWANYPLVGWEALVDATEPRGADTTSVGAWLERNGYEIRRYRRPETKQLLVYAERSAIEAWAVYYDALNAPVPDGWLSGTNAALYIGCSDSHFAKLVERDGVGFTERGQTRYYDPADIERLRDDYNDRAPEGWGALTDAARAHGSDANNIKRWLERNDYETRRYRHRGTNLLSLFAPNEAIGAWVASYQKKDIGSSLLETLRDLTEPLTAPQLSELTRHSLNAVYTNLRRLHADGGLVERSDERPARWIAKHND